MGLYYKDRAEIQHPIFVDRILQHLRTASIDNWINGLDWYKNANLTIRMLAAKHKKPINYVAAVTAILSRNTRWEINIQMTEEFLETGKIRHLKAVKKQIKQLDDVLNPLDIITGPKIRAFYQNLLNPFSPTSVTIDRWIYFAIYGKAPKGSSKTLSKRIQKAFLEAAKILNSKGIKILAHQIQAVIWEKVREIFSTIPRYA